MSLVILLGELLFAFSVRAAQVTAIKCRDVRSGGGYGLLASVEATQTKANDNIYVYEINSSLKLQAPYSTLLEISKEFVHASMVLQNGGWQLSIDARDPATNQYFNFMGNSGRSDRTESINWAEYSYRDRQKLHSPGRVQLECAYGTFSEP